MANVQVDSDLMLHMMPSLPVTSQRRFTAVYDNTHKPLLFSISSQGQFVAIKADGSGNNVVINLSQILNVPDATQAFAVSQSTNNNGTLFVAFATANGPTSSNLHVLAPIVPTDLDLPPTELRKKVLIPVAQPQGHKITHLFMNRTADASYPLVIAAHTDVNGDVNVARIAITETSWSWATDIHIPELAKGFIDMCAGRTAIGNGLFILYTVAGKYSLIYALTEPGLDIVVDLKLPPSATPLSLGTFLDTDGLSNLLVSGGGLYYFNADDLIQSGSLAKQISNDPFYHQGQDLYISQSDTVVSAWFKTEQGVLAYQRGSNDAEFVGSPVQLLPSGSSVEFAPLIDPSSKSQVLMVMDNQFKISVFEQASENLMWNKTPFLIKQVEQLTEISAFVCRIQVTTPTNWPLGKTKFRLSSSAWVTVLVNEAQLSVGKAGADVETDVSGVLTLVVPSGDMSCPTFTLLNAPNSNLLPPSGFLIDPTQKMQQKLATIKSKDDLKSATTSDGRPLLQGSNATDPELEQAALAIKNMASVSMGTHQPAAAAVQSLAVVTPGSTGILEKAWEFWQFIQDSFEAIERWSVEQLNNAWNFVVHIGDEIWSFILNGFEAVCKAVTFVFDKIKVAFENVIGFFGWLFNWGDIKQTRDSIKTMVNAGLDFGAKFLKDSTKTVENFFDGLEAQVLPGLVLHVPPDVASKKQGPEDSLQPGADKSGISQSARANVGGYHFEQVKNALPTNIPALQPFITLYDTLIEPVLDEAAARIDKIATDIVTIFNNSQDMSLEDIIQLLAADLVGLFTGILKRLAVGFLNLGAALIDGLKSIINANVDIPIITPLLKKLGVPDFSFLDAVALILAIPVTVFAKAITGQAPQRIQTFDYQAMVDGKLDKNSMLAYNELASYLDITYTVFNILLKVYKIFTAEAPEPETFSYAGFVLKLIVQAATFPYDTESPGRDFRIAIWSVLTSNVLIQAACLKAQVKSAKVTAGAEVVTGLVAFILTQIVHGQEFNTDYKEKDDAVTGLSVATSVFELIGGLAGSYGAIAPDPIEKGIAAVVVAGGKACESVIKVGKSSITLKKNYYNFISGSV